MRNLLITFTLLSLNSFSSYAKDNHITLTSLLSSNSACNELGGEMISGITNNGTRNVHLCVKTTKSNEKHIGYFQVDEKIAYSCLEVADELYDKDGNLALTYISDIKPGVCQNH